MSLTPRQSQVVSAIRDYRHLNGYSPTMQEIADQLGITSKVTIFEHLGALERKGVISRLKHKARSLEVVESEGGPEKTRDTCLPVLASFVPGSPLQPLSGSPELDLENIFKAAGGVYVLRVKGDMTEENLFDGDCVVVERREKPRIGETVVAVIDGGGAIVRRYYEAGGTVRLLSASEGAELIVVSAASVKIMGIVIGMVRCEKQRNQKSH